MPKATTPAETKSGEPILHFRDPAAFELWLAAATSHSAVWLKLAKKGSTAVTLSQKDAIDCALCHGWIDGQISRLDEDFYLTRFTPRKPASRWSENNRRRVEELEAAGRVTARGLAEIDAAKRDGRWEAAYPSASAAQMPEDFRAAIEACRAAAERFAVLDGANRYALLYRLHHCEDARRREEMITRFVAMLERGETFHEPRKPRARAP
jgi:uncharacterized protein YdeI (YjbR/CyaY-like superfamily)